MGSPAMNLARRQGDAGANGARQIVLERHDHPPIVLPIPASADETKLSDGAKVIFGIRPEAVNDKESVDRNAKSVATFDAKVEIVEPAGSDTYVVTRACRQGTDGADARRHPGARRGEPHLRLQPGQGGAVRSADVTPDLKSSEPFGCVVRDPAIRVGASRRRFEDLMAEPGNVPTS